MNIEGTYTLQAPPEKVWQYLMHQQVLQRTIPGITSIEQINTDSYQIVVEAKNAPLKGSYQGRMLLSELQYPYHYRLTLEGEGAQLNGSGSIHLNGLEHTTIIAYKGTLHLNKRGSLLKPNLIKGAAKLFIQQFFTALAEQLKLNAIPEPTITTETVEVPPTQKAPVESITIIQQTRTKLQPSSQTVLHKVIHAATMGQATTEQEAFWEKRLRRFSLLSGLLFLVWVGTRLPRRR